MSFWLIDFLYGHYRRDGAHSITRPLSLGADAGGVNGGCLGHRTRSAKCRSDADPQLSTRSAANARGCMLRSVRVMRRRYHLLHGDSGRASRIALPLPKKVADRSAGLLY